MTKKRWTLKELRSMAHELGWGLTTSEPGQLKTFKYFVKIPGKPPRPAVDLEMAAVPILNEWKRRGYVDTMRNPLRD